MNGLLNRNANEPLLLLACAIVAGTGLTGVARVRINTTDSLPKGLYIVTADSNAPLVEFCPQGVFSGLSVQRGYRPIGLCPDGAAPLLKPVIATEGDEVKVSAAGISVNGNLLPNTIARPADSAGRPLTPWSSGTYTVAPATVWVASTHHPNSFDSRYFGPVRCDQIWHHLRALWVLGLSSTAE
jgi:conjugative transfer signal peptidase TraF